MEKIATVFCLICVTSLTKADLIADWNFNASFSGTSISATHGLGTLDLSGLYNTSDATYSSSGGSGQNEYSSDLSGGALYIQAGTKTGSIYPENGKSIIFSITTLGYQNIILTYAASGASTSFTTQTWSYSTDGGNSYSSSGISGSPVSVPASYTTETVDFSSVTALNNDSSTVFIELTLSGATATSGSDHFDNIQFNGTLSLSPEPATWGAISALGLLGICGLREWRQKRQAKAA